MQQQDLVVTIHRSPSDMAGGGGGAGFGQAGGDASFNEVTNDASGGQGGWIGDASGTSSITGTSLQYGGGGGGGVVMVRRINTFGSQRSRWWGWWRWWFLYCY